MRRLGLVLMVGMVSLALWASPAWAGMPDRKPVESGDLVAAAACPFPVLIHVVTNMQYSIEFFDRTITQGHLVLQLTNMDNPDISVTRNVSGPGTITHADGVLIATGPWFLSFEPGELVDMPEGAMFINYGRIVILLGDPSSGIPHDILGEPTGVQEDVCETLRASPDGEALGTTESESSGVEPFPGAAVTERSDGEGSGGEASEFDVRPLQSPTYAPSE
jgi:hypothetical protein